MTTKLYDDDQGFEKALEACELSLEKLGLEYIGKFGLRAQRHRGTRADVNRGQRTLVIN